MMRTKVLPPWSCPFWDIIDFKLSIKNQDSEKNPKLWPSLLSCPRDSDREPCFRKILGCCLRLRGLKYVNRGIQRGACQLDTPRPVAAASPSEKIPSTYVQLFLSYPSFFYSRSWNALTPVPHLPHLSKSIYILMLPVFGIFMFMCIPRHMY